MVWQMLAALVFLSAMVRALWLPETSNGCQLCEAGICTFLLCFCWELPGCWCCCSTASRRLICLRCCLALACAASVRWGFSLWRGWQEVTEGLQYPDTPLVELLKRFP